MHDHRGDYGIDGWFHTVSARGQAIGVDLWRQDQTDNSQQDSAASQPRMAHVVRRSLVLHAPGHRRKAGVRPGPAREV